MVDVQCMLRRCLSVGQLEYAAGQSIYEGYFEDENFSLDHKAAGVVSMYNNGKPNTNGSQVEELTVYWTCYCFSFTDT